MIVQQTTTTWIETEIFYGYKFKDLDHFIDFTKKIIAMRPEPTGKEILSHFHQSNEDLLTLINNKSNYTGNKYYPVNIALINIGFTFQSIHLYITQQNGVDYNYYIKPWDWDPNSEKKDDSFNKIMFSDNNTDLDFIKTIPTLPDELIKIVESIDKTILPEFKFHLNMYQTNEEEY